MVTQRPDERRTVTCKGCAGQVPREHDGRTPPGWYHLSVSVPVELDGHGRGYVWAGLFCSVRCLAASVPDLRRQEDLAHQVYEPVRPLMTGDRR